MLITVLLSTFWLIFDLNISYLNEKMHVLSTLKKHYPVNKTSHNRILQSTLSFYYKFDSMTQL